MKALVLHQERCTGCSLCEVICGLAHFKENNPKKAAIHIERKFPEPGTFEIRVCNQCGRCREICPSEAISEKEGVLKQVFESLQTVSVSMVSYGASPNNISVLVPTAQKEKTLQALNKGLFGLD